MRHAILVTADCCNRLHDLANRIVWAWTAPTSTAFTHVPVEEPSTASWTDTCVAPNSDDCA